MKNYNIFLMAALLGAAVVSCQKEEEISAPAEKAPKVATLTLQAGALGSKAMSLSDKELDVYWVEGETVNVFLKGGSYVGTLEAVEVALDTHHATLTGDITVDDFANGENQISLLFPGRNDHEWTYAGQDASVPSEAGNMATKFDYAEALISVTYNESAGTLAFEEHAVDLENGQSVFRFRSNMAMSSFTVSSAGNKIVVERTMEDGWVSTYGSVAVTPASSTLQDGYYNYYVAIRDENAANDTFFFSHVADGGALYEASKAIPAAALSAGYVSAKITMTQKAYSPQSSTISSELDVL